MCAMRGQSYVITLFLVFAMCLTAVAAGQPGTSDVKVVSQQQPSLQAAAPVSAESLMQKIEEAFRGTSGACVFPVLHCVPYSLLFFMLECSSSPRPF